MEFRNCKWLAMVATLVGLVFVVTDTFAKKPDNPPAKEDPVFTAYSDGLIEPIDSYSVDHDWQIVFRHAHMDLTQFEGTDRFGSCNHGLRTGIITLRPKSPKNPLLTRLDFWFQSELESGEAVTHLFLMEGVFDQPGSWPPQDTTTLTFDYWEFAAENKWAQRQDCAGELAGYPTDDYWTVTVTLKK